MGSLKFTYVAGLLIRRQVRQELERMCFKHNLDLDLKESKGLLETEYLVKITGLDHIIKACISRW